MGSNDLPPDLFQPSFVLVPVPNPPAEETRLAMLAKTPTERAQFVLDLAIFTDQLTQSIDTIEAIMQRAGQMSAPGGCIIVGEGGCGKTFVRGRILRRYPPRHGGLRSFVPAVSFQLKATPTPESVRTAILDQLGHIGKRTGLSLAERDEDVVKALQSCGTRAILIDEAHHLQLTSGQRQNRDRLAGLVGDYLKELYDAARVGFIFLGKDTLGELFDLDAQLHSRWSGKVSLRTYAKDESWYELLDALDRALPLDEPAGLGDKALADQVYGVVRGNFRKLKIYLSEAVRQAALAEAKHLEREHFRMAYYVLGNPPPNPFGPRQP
jgi:hypothetical protein